ncbi:MAG: hypothetical protein UR68_C0008G0018 [Candidatus Roizmanbacteria bacterium GW2011_GWA2_35_19]|uniref:PPC domain-containing protein n=2 Tax=Candidatus Roizmaniibacteriota TaxID=1752723 RepID=A0A0G0F177_9BACT|nr:MAG: hypothetical protein UR63_C0011G0020 [Candidatus Roizmanbacteria bacterium GW2011_GWC2_35_12]KKP73107.1 MAG: hypothetical protein UR68_C0008G0018 [Candidatus Roizmanbacteria bacterium GW2011_GWA2_35_19]
MKLLEFKINKGQEVIDVLNKGFKKINLNKGAIVSVIGAVDECCISNMPKEDAKKDILKTFKEPMELSGTGEIRDGKAHIHCTLSKEENVALHGHLHWAKVEAWYV